MKLDLTELAGNVGKTYHYEIREQCDDEEYSELRCTEPIVGKADFTNTGNLILARGQFRTTIQIECSRCLTDTVVPVEVNIEEQFSIEHLQTIAAGHVEEEVTGEEAEPLFQDNIFDLSEYIRQSVLVQVPIKPLCNDICQGLCPTCGRNLNEGPCDCPVEVEASPFSALQQLLEDGDDSGQSKEE